MKINNDIIYDSNQILSVKIAVGSIIMTQLRTPTAKDISAFSRCIRDCLNDQVESIIWTNPKILVTEVDTPILLHEGCRYNALHIAARNGNSRATKIILKAIGSKKFMDILYPEDDDDNKK